MVREKQLTYFHKIPERKLLSGGVYIYTYTYTYIYAMKMLLYLAIFNAYEYFIY